MKYVQHCRCRDSHILTAGDDMKLKIWSKDGNYIGEVLRDHKNGYFTGNINSKIWTVSYSGGRIVGIENWGLGTLPLLPEERSNMFNFVQSSGRVWE